MSDFKLETYDTILFDLDSTLVNTNDYPLKAIDWILDQCTDASAEVREKCLISLVRAYLEGIKGIVKGGPYITPFEVVRSAITEGLASIGVNPDSDFILEGTKYFKNLHVELATLYPSVDDLLKALRDNGTKIGLITNGFVGHSTIILEKLDILRYFDLLIDSGGAQNYKPSPVPYKLALEQLESTPENSLYVGNEFLADVVGAKSVGISAVWVNLR
ncbi:MAG: HAD family hydrolase, partial [Candidatus Thorarchaeota archaeon]